MPPRLTTATATSTSTDAHISAIWPGVEKPDFREPMRDILEQPERILNYMREIAAVEIMPRFQMLASHEIMEKKPGDLVTVADHASEAAFRRALPSLVPWSVVLGEEGYEADPKSLRMLNDTAPVWIVDPVDGTHNFAHGLSPFTVIVALVKEGETRGGWIIDPLADDAVWAVHGGGACYAATADGETMRLAAQARPFADTTMTAGEKLKKRLERAAAELNSPLPGIVERYRCVGREYMDIAHGQLDFARYGGRLKPWDHAAGCLIVREAGGRADMVESEMPYTVGGELPTQSIGIAGDHALWAPFRRLVKHADELS